MALGKLAMSITFNYVNNTRTEKIMFEIVDMDFPYNAIIGRGTVNIGALAISVMQRARRVSKQERVHIYRHWILGIVLLLGIGYWLTENQRR
jgi:hypothetical protein